MTQVKARRKARYFISLVGAEARTDGGDAQRAFAKFLIGDEAEIRAVNAARKRDERRAARAQPLAQGEFL
jgi:hypothetical protein